MMKGIQHLANIVKIVGIHALMEFHIHVILDSSKPTKTFPTVIVPNVLRDFIARTKTVQHLVQAVDLGQ